MGTEPERKFLLNDDSWKTAVVEKSRIVQAYLSKEPGRTVRIRIRDDEAFITIKGKAPEGTIDTPEFEYEIPLTDAEDLLKLCLPGVIEKVRHYVPFGGKTWEVDIFEGANKGLVMAEIELVHGRESFEKPAWAGTEVTHDKRFTNASLSERPYSTWKEKPPGKPRPAGPAP